MLLLQRLSRLWYQDGSSCCDDNGCCGMWGTAAADLGAAGEEMESLRAFEGSEGTPQGTFAALAAAAEPGTGATASGKFSFALRPWRSMAPMS